MEQLERMSPEILIYLQNLRKHLKDNEVARKYFEIDRNEEAFFEYLTELSIKNFKDSGEPQLTLEQFELIRQRMNGEVDPERKVSLGLFMSLGVYGGVSLN